MWFCIVSPGAWLSYARFVVNLDQTLLSNLKQSSSVVILVMIYFTWKSTWTLSCTCLLSVGGFRSMGCVFKCTLSSVFWLVYLMSVQKRLQDSLMRPRRLTFTWNDRYPTLNTLTHVHNYDITSFSNCKAPGLPGVLLEEFIFYFRWVKVEEAVPNSSLLPESTRISPTKGPFPCHRVCCKNHVCRPGRWKFAGSRQLGEWLEDLKGLECTCPPFGNNAVLASHYVTYSFQVNI